MLNFQYSPGQFVFTSYIPNTINIESDAKSVKVSIKCDGEIIFTTTLYPYDDIATLYDPRSVIEEYMEEKALNFVKLVFITESSESVISTSESTTIYSRVNVETVDVSYFIRCHFLTSLSSFVIPRDGTQSLTYITYENQEVEAYTECLIQVDGEEYHRLVRLKETEVKYDHIAIHSFAISPQQIINKLGLKGRILQLTVHRGALAKTFYVVDRTPNLTLIVRNEFNAEEYIHLNCVTKRKLVLGRSTTTCLGTTAFYDDKSEYEYEVESAMLRYEEACHFSELLLSYSIELLEFNQARIPIIITDLSSEVSDADNATNSIKFKYKFTTRRFPATFKYPVNVFDDPFHRTFD